MVFVGIFQKRAIGGIACRNGMHIQVEWHQFAIAFRKQKLGEACFLTDLAEGDLRDIALALGMAPGLQPAIEFSVMDQQTPLPVG